MLVNVDETKKELLILLKLKKEIKYLLCLGNTTMITVNLIRVYSNTELDLVPGSIVVKYVFLSTDSDI